MDMYWLEEAVGEIKAELEYSIFTATFNGKPYGNGQQAKEALIRSQNLILKIHEVVKKSLVRELDTLTNHYSIHPPLGQRNPELAFSGLIKRKKQDIVALFGRERRTPELITDGALAGAINSIGRDKSESSIVISVRSQLSSIEKNFDTLMERAFAETLNLRLRLPKLVMGEVYLLPVVEYDDKAMQRNKVDWKLGHSPVEKFVRTFLGITHRDVDAAGGDIYKYERSALILVDFRQTPPKIFLTLDELKKGGFVPSDFEADFDLLSPSNFTNGIVSTHRSRHLYLY